MEVNQAEFGRMAGVTRAAIGSKIKNKTLISNSAGFLDTDNPLNRAYLDKKRAERRGIGSLTAASVSSNQNQTQKNSYQPTVPAFTNSNIPPSELLSLTVREIVQKFGSIDGVEKYAKILRDLTTADERTQRLQERRQEQIPKDFVVSRLFSFTNQMANKVLDAPESFADQVIALAQSVS